MGSYGKLNAHLTLGKAYIVCIRIKLYKYFKAHDVVYESQILRGFLENCAKNAHGFQIKKI